jgi:hypothetical protein
MQAQHIRMAHNNQKNLNSKKAASRQLQAASKTLPLEA